MLTEEDVLACAVLCTIINAPDEQRRDWDFEDMVRRLSDEPPEFGERILPAGVVEIVRQRRGDRPWPEVVADSERRLEVAEYERAVLLWCETANLVRGGRATLDALDAAVDRWLAARRALEGK